MININRVVDSSFLNKWREQVLDFAVKVNPDIDKKDLIERLNQDVSNRCINTDVELHNNYTNTRQPSNILDVLDWCVNNNPILASSGVLFKQHHQEENPNADILEEMGIERKVFKKKAHQAAEAEGYGSEGFKVNNRIQNSKKRGMNSFYGGSGMASSHFYNLYQATSITGVARAIIATSMCAFEKFLANNVAFLSVSDCITFIMQVVYEKHDYNILDYADSYTSVNACYNKLINTFYNVEELTQDDKDKILNILKGLTADEVTRIYYKNNLYEFCSLYPIKDRLYNLIDTLCTQRDYKELNAKGKYSYDLNKLFIDPNEVPSVIHDDMYEFWHLLEAFVAHKHQTMDKMNKLLHFERKAVITIDTDSNFLNLNPWYEFCLEVMGDRIDEYEQEPIIIDTNILNIMSCICTWYINLSLIDIVQEWGVENVEKAKLISFKNEFHMPVVILTDAKKNYASIIARQENAMLSPMEIDIKGLPIKKSTLNDAMQNELIAILEDEVLRAKDIRVGRVVGRLSKLEDKIKGSLSSGQTEYLKPASVKQVQFYKNPSSESGINGIAVWNSVYPKDTIQLPTAVNLVRVKMQKLGQISELAETHREIFDILVKNFYKCGIEDIEKKGISWIALPFDEVEVPEWIRPYIDYDTIVNNNLSPFNSLLNSLGVKELPTFESTTTYSNIIQL